MAGDVKTGCTTIDKAIKAGKFPAGTDINAVHKLEPSEFVAPPKTAADTDKLLVEEAGGAKAVVTVADVKGSGGGVSDADALHKAGAYSQNELSSMDPKLALGLDDVFVLEDRAVGAEQGDKKVAVLTSILERTIVSRFDADDQYGSLTDKPTPVAADRILIEDSAGGTFDKKRIELTDLIGGGGADPNAVHVNVDGEINGIALQKNVPVAEDMVLLEDSAATFGKKKVSVGSLTSIVDPVNVGTSRDFALTDFGKMVNCTNDGADITITIRLEATVEFLSGTVLRIRRASTVVSEVTVAKEAGVIFQGVLGDNPFKLDGTAGFEVKLEYRGSDIWLISGNVKAA